MAGTWNLATSLEETEVAEVAERVYISQETYLGESPLNPSFERVIGDREGTVHGVWQITQV